MFIISLPSFFPPAASKKEIETDLHIEVEEEDGGFLIVIEAKDKTSGSLGGSHSVSKQNAKFIMLTALSWPLVYMPLLPFFKFRAQVGK